MKVLIPTPLRSYVKNKSEVEGRGRMLKEVLSGLDADYPGIKFRMIDELDRIRVHIRLFVGGKMATDLDHPVAPGQDVQIICALSGGR